MDRRRRRHRRGRFRSSRIGAQAVVEEPGYCAQYYPNANCQNYGPGNPATDPGGAWRNGWQNGHALMLPRGHRQHRTHRG